MLYIVNMIAQIV